MKEMDKIGKWSFMAGVVLAILAGLFGTTSGTLAMILVVLGIIVGFLNITKKEVYNFLLATIALLVAGAAGLENLPVIGALISPIVLNIATFVAPAAVIVALKAVYELGKKK